MINHKTRVLIVEDERVVAGAIQKNLVKFGYDVPFELNQSYILGLVFIPLIWIFIYFISGYYKNVFKKSRLQELGLTIGLTLVGMVAAGGIAWGQHDTMIKTHEKAIAHHQTRIDRMEKVYVEQNGMIREIHGMLKARRRK